MPRFTFRSTATQPVCRRCDAVKPASKAALDALKALGLDVILLTGDSRTNADRVAAQVGLDDAHVVSGLAPAELEAELRRLQTNGPAAHDRQYFCRRGTGLCRCRALAWEPSRCPPPDVMLLRDDLTDAAAAVRISRAVDARIAQNTAWRWLTARCCRCWPPVCFTR